MKKIIKFSLATKLATIFGGLLLFVMFSITLAVRETIQSRFTSQYKQNVQSSLDAIKNSLIVRKERVGRQLNRLASKLKDDNQFRLHTAVLEDYQNPYIVDYAENYMQTMGLQALEITDGAGVLLSSGHYRSAFGGSEKPLIDDLRSLGSEVVFAWLQRPDGKFLCSITMDSTYLGDKKFYVIGGIQINPSFLRELIYDSTQVVILQLQEVAFSTSPEWAAAPQQNKISAARDDSTFSENLYEDFSIDSLMLPVISDGSIHEAAIFILHPNTEFQQLLESLNKRIFLIIGAGVLITILFSIIQARDVTKPLQQLAIAAGSLSLEKLDVDFDAMERNDEVGVLNDALQKMVRHLRQNRVELAEAEQKAAFAEISRQINHDVKNGFIPIRNVMQHWMEVAVAKPEQLPLIFNERKATVMESLDYLESLAKKYSRIEPKISPAKVSVNKIILKLLKNYLELPNREIFFRTELDPSDPNVYVDAIQFRRAFENVLQNAIEAIAEKGTILISTEMKDSQVFVSCRDNGSGIPEEIRRQLLVNPVTTKPEGTGLGLVNVKHIIEASGGSLQIESEVGRGTIVRFTLPRLSAENVKLV